MAVHCSWLAECVEKKHDVLHLNAIFFLVAAASVGKGACCFTVILSMCQGVLADGRAGVPAPAQIPR